MNCKNCEKPLELQSNYCRRCGAKVITNRLSFRNIWVALRENYLNYDNTFLITFIHLFTKPEKVISGYISGVRKQYMNPLSYLGIALTLSGIQLFITQKVSDKINWDIFEQGVNPELTAKLTEIVFDFSSFIYVLYIPVFAVSGWLSINARKFLLSEFVIVFFYILAHWSIAIFIPLILILLTAPNYYLHLSFPALAILIGYSIYCLQRIHRYLPRQLIMRSGIFIILAMAGYFGIIILFYILLFATGTVTLQDFVPVKP